MAKGIITSREQNAQFDAAVKEIMKQRKAAQQLQMAARQHKQLSKNGGPSNAQQVAQLKENRAKLQALVRAPEFAQLASDRGAYNSDIASMTKRRSSDALNTSHHNKQQQRRPSRKLNHPHLSLSTNTAAGNNSNPVVNSHGLQQLRKEHPRRGSGGSGSSGSFNNRRATVDLGVAANRPRQFSSSLPNYDSTTTSDGDAPPSRSVSGGSNIPTRRFTLDRSQSFAAVNNLLSKSKSQDDSLLPQAPPMKKNMSSNELSDMTMNTADKSLSLTPPRELPLTKGTYKPKSKTKSPGRKNLKVKDGSPHGEGKEIVLDGSEGSNNRARQKQQRGSWDTGLTAQRQIIMGSASQHTRNVSTTSSQSIGELDLGGGGATDDISSPANALSLSNRLGGIKLEDLVPTRRKSQDMSEGDDKIVDQWRNEDLKLEPGGDFTLAASSETVGDNKPKEEDRKKTLTPSSSGRSYHTAHSREASSSPILEQGGDRRVILKSQAKSQSGNTGRTAGTSASSLLSSGDSFRANLADSTHGKSGSSSPNFEVITEDDGKDAGGDSRRKIGMQRSTSEADIGDSARQEREFGDSFEHDMPGFLSYKERRSSRIKKIRRSIAMTLMGGSSNRSPPDGDQSESGISSHQGSAISAEQQERLTRHLQRKSSAKSFNSAHTSTSAVTTSSNHSQSSSSRWSRFRKGKSHSMRNMQSSGVDSNRGSNSRHILLTSRRRMSNRSNSSRSNVSNISNDDSQSNSFSGRFIDFYDNNDHAQAVSTLITSKSASNRSLMTPLPTVDEPEGEQKHDEDYHSMRDDMKPEKSAYHLYMEDSGHSDDTMTYYRHPSHEHTLVHMCPTQLFPDSPGWQCDECCKETFDLKVWAYISTEQNYCLCQECFSK